MRKVKQLSFINNKVVSRCLKTIAVVSVSRDAKNGFLDATKTREIKNTFSEEMVHEIEDFYGVYLLFCLNPKYKGRTYIGYTVDPNRRIKQHNTGRHAGGAFRTSGRGPWDMVLIIHGFPNDVSGLRFEWAWQNPDKSRRLRDVPAKSRKESAFQYRWRVVCNMLKTAPWCGLSLTVRWLKQDFQLDFPQGLEPPLHMPVVFGPVVRKRLKSSKSKANAIASSQTMCPSGTQTAKEPQHLHDEVRHCPGCYKQILVGEKTLNCLSPTCTMMAHIICLAEIFLSDPSMLLPVEGQCPLCKVNLLWGELVRYKNICSRNCPGSDYQQDTITGQDKLTVISDSEESS